MVEETTISRRRLCRDCAGTMVSPLTPSDCDRRIPR